MRFTVLESRLEGPLLLEPRSFADDRGFFMETYRRSELAELGVTEEFVQDNHSRSARGVVRGMHFQVGRGVSKLVRCARGEIVDVLVDIRRGSPSCGEWEAFTLSDTNRYVLYAPIGFAHGFCTLEPDTQVLYKVDQYYARETEAGLLWSDPDLAIPWPVAPEHAIVSDKDEVLPRLRDVVSPFNYSDPQSAGR